MATFSNSFGAPPATTAAYVQSLLDLLGDQDPLEILPRVFEEVRGRIEGVDDARLRRPEAERKWSVVQALQHLADTEIVYGFRYRMILSHDTPEIAGFDQDLWVEKLHYAGADPGEACEQLRVMREANLRLLRSASDGDLRRVGLHSERGAESVRLMMKMHAAHDLVHLRQIDRILAAVR
ncbi:MAG TPA: DinB family protein [Thermoanaerobaculia bacterium]|nr:DinB family protein [Thermoanaerobaculia bacterium]